MGRKNKKSMFCGEPFTDLNISIIGMIVIYMSQPDIAYEQGITEHNLQNKIDRIMIKLNIKTKEQLIVLALNFGFNKYGFFDVDYIFNQLIN